MPKLPVLNASEAIKLLIAHGFILIRTKGSHHIYIKNNQRIVIPFHGKKSLHPKIVAEILDAING